MIIHALDLRDAFNTYAIKLRVLKNTLNLKTYKQDYLTDNK
jgi:hypothetical protein